VLELIVIVLIIGIIGLSSKGAVVLVKKLDQMIEPIYRYETLDLFEKYGIREDFENLFVRCKICQTPITFNNLCLIVEENNSLNLYCDNPACNPVQSEITNFDENNKEYNPNISA